MKRGALLLSAALVLCGCREKAPDHIQKARSAVFEKKPQQALEHYRRALDLLERDSSPEAQVHKARALRGAADIYDLELRDYRRAVEVYRELVKACPEAPEALEARIRLATILKEQFNDLRGSIKELTAAISRNPPQSAELRYRVAKLYFELGDYQQSEIEAKEVSRRYETSSFVDDASFLEAQALGMQQKREEAVRAYQALVEKHAGSEYLPHAMFELGRLYADSGDGVKAIEVWVAALAGHPQPETVQAAINRTRKRIHETTPLSMAREDVFDRSRPVPVDAGAVKKPVDTAAVPLEKTSVEAAGGTAEEAAKDQGD